MSCKSAIYTANTSSQVLAVGDTVNLGSIVRRFGSNLTLSGDSIVTSGIGYYEINASLSVSPTAAGTVTVIATKDGVTIPGASASATTTVAGDVVSLSIDALVRESCPCDTRSAISFVLYGAASTVSNIAVTVEKL